MRTLFALWLVGAVGFAANMPAPHGGAFQRIATLHVDSPYRHEILTGAEDNHIPHVRVTDPKEPAIAVTLRFDAVRQEHIQPLAAASPAIGAAAPSGPEWYLQPNRLVPLDETTRRWAREVVRAAGVRTDLEMARAIYNHVVATVKYDKSGKEWGNSDIYYACDTRRGNCTDFHAIFIGYAGAVGIPTRLPIGFPLRAGRGAGKISGYHCWVELSKGRDAILAPEQQGAPLNYLVYPYVERDGGNYTGVETSYLYKDLPL